MESMPHSIAAAFGRTAQVAAQMGILQPPLRLDSQACGVKRGVCCALHHFRSDTEQAETRRPSMLCWLWGQLTSTSGFRRQATRRRFGTMRLVQSSLRKQVVGAATPSARNLTSAQAALSRQ